MNTIKKIGLSASLLLAFGFANAASYDLANHEDNFAHDVSVAGLFTDVFSVTLNPGATGSIFFSAAKADISEFTTILFQGNGVNLAGSMGSFGKFSLAEVSVDSLGGLIAGTYTISVTGNALFSEAGYSVDSTFAAIASPVPEPSSIALMLGGLGLVGFMAARRKKA
ncbi:MAG: FxDxF family PEP-CTERM protein [Thiomicrorhabdus sp.]|nr:FxDxF family PEP-CTERM protein [Thiomicrorhabdus sp.]